MARVQWKHLWRYSPLLLSLCGSHGVYAGVIAASKNHYWLPWSLGGILFGPIVLIATAGLPDRKLHRYVRLISGDKDEPRRDSGNVTRPRSLNPSDLR